MNAVLVAVAVAVAGMLSVVAYQGGLAALFSPYIPVLVRLLPCLLHDASVHVADGPREP